MNALVIFAKFPAPGEVKTRLGKKIGMENSAELCKHMVEDLINKNKSQNYDVYLSFISHEYKEDYREMFPDAILYVQRGKDMGDNLALTFEDLLDDYDKVALIGGDAPQVGPRLVNAAFKALESYDVVIGPASDGGYYLIGISRYHDFFRGLPWGEPTLLKKTAEELKKRGLSHTDLEELDDIDDIEELELAKKKLSSDDAPATASFLRKLES